MRVTIPSEYFSARTAPGSRIVAFYERSRGTLTHWRWKDGKDGNDTCDLFFPLSSLLPALNESGAEDVTYWVVEVRLGSGFCFRGI